MNSSESENSSTCSTSIVDSGVTTEERRSRKQCCKKEVSFNLSHNVHYNTTTSLFKTDIKKLWYNENDLQSFKKKRKSAADMVLRIESHDKNKETYTSILQHVLCMCDAFSEDSVNILHRTLRNPCAHMAHHLAYQPQRLGIEKIVLSSLRKGKGTRRAEQMNLLLELQQQKTSHDVHDGQELLFQQHCMRISLPSRQIAHFLAKAQEESLSLQK